MTSADAILLVAAVLLLIGVATATRSARTGLWQRRQWRIAMAAWIAITGAIVLYSSYVVSNL